MLKLEIDITREDYADFNKFHFVQTRLKRSVIVAFATLIVLEVYLNKDKLDILATVVSALAAVLIYFGLIYLALARTKHIPKENGSILGQRSMDFSEEGINCTTKNSSTSSKWSSIRKIEQGFTALYLYTDANQAYIVPKRYLSDRKQEEEFLAWARQRIAQAHPA